MTKIVALALSGIFLTPISVGDSVGMRSADALAEGTEQEGQDEAPKPSVYCLEFEDSESYFEADEAQQFRLNDVGDRIKCDPNAEIWQVPEGSESFVPVAAAANFGLYSSIAGAGAFSAVQLGNGNDSPG